MAGLDADGFTIERFAEIREGINEQMRASFGPSIDVSDGSIEGVTIAIVSERIAEVWELAEAVHNATDPDSATGAAQDQLCALTGTEREAARASTVTLTLTGTTGTVVDSGSKASTSDTEEEFETLADGTLVAVSAWVLSTAYSTLGTRRKNGGNVYQLTGAGTSASSGGPTGTSDSITDGTCVWRYLGAGDGAVDVAAKAVDTGPLVATSGSITNIETPVSGWDGVINVLDADVGADIESHEDLRIRREVELATPGSAPLDALRAELLDVDGVTSVTIFENKTDTTDADGVPPHAVECLVLGGEDQDIFDRLHSAVAGGIATSGTETGTATDSAGNVHAYAFSRPDEIEIYVALTIVKVSGEYPEDGDDQVKAAIVAFGDAQRTGKNAVASAISAQAFKVAGVLDVSVCYIGTAPSPVTSTTIAISPRQLATFDTSRIDVTAADGEA